MHSRNMLFKCIFCLMCISCFVKAAFAPYIALIPTITVYKPCGLQISIPDKQGMNLVIFYVSVNNSVLSEEPDYTQLITEEVDGNWIFDKRTIKLEDGDVVFYSVYVQKYNRGYMYHGTPFTVSERVKRPLSSHRPLPYDENNFDACPDVITPHSSKETLPSSTSSNTLNLSTTTALPTIPSPDYCSLALNTVLSLLSDTRNELKDAKTDVEILKELASMQPNYLHLSGLLTEAGEPKEVVEFTFFEKLNTRLKVKSATKTGTTITFELFSFEDKLDILKRAKMYLKDSENILITP